MQKATIPNCFDVNIEYWLYNEPDMKLNENDINHVQKLIRDGYIEGELCGGDTGDGETYGWWKLSK